MRLFTKDKGPASLSVAYDSLDGLLYMMVNKMRHHSLTGHRDLWYRV